MDRCISSTAHVESTKTDSFKVFIFISHWDQLLLTLEQLHKDMMIK